MMVNSWHILGQPQIYNQGPSVPHCFTSNHNFEILAFFLKSSWTTLKSGSGRKTYCSKMYAIQIPPTVEGFVFFCFFVYEFWSSRFVWSGRGHIAWTRFTHAKLGMSGLIWATETNSYRSCPTARIIQQSVSLQTNMLLTSRTLTF